MPTEYYTKAGIDSTSATTSGAHKVGFPAIAGIAGGVATKVYNAIVDLKSQIDGKASLARGLPPGGTTDQTIKKIDATDFNVTWGSPSGAPDAATGTKGITKLSVAPVSSTNPIAAGDNDTRLGDARTPLVHKTSHDVGGSDPVTRYGEMAFYFSGALTVKTGVGRYPAFVSGTIVGIRATINTAPTGASVIVDVNKNGTTMYSTQANRPTIAVSTNSVNATLPNTTTFVAGDYVTVDCDQIGSTVAGSDLVVVIRYSY